MTLPPRWPYARPEQALAEHHGVWGGTSERERRRLRRKLTAHTNPPA